MYKANDGQGPASGDRQTPSGLVDNYGRLITYLRLAITDRCNLRCRYCMPEEGVSQIDHDQTLSYEEMERLVTVFLGFGVSKIRLTGGEPFVRRGCLEFMEMLRYKLGVEHLFVTTNGVETWKYLDGLKKIGISGINLSLDTIDPVRFKQITRRDRLHDVLLTYKRSLELGIPLKINSVVLDDTTDEEIINLATLVRDHAISLRFIEQMPFSGELHHHNKEENILCSRLEKLFPGLKEYSSEAISTAKEFRLPGFAGRLGIIEGHSRNFCKTCNKVRVTPQGMLKACLYDNGILDVRAMLRDGVSDVQLSGAILEALQHRNADGHETEEKCSRKCEPSMATIGG